MSKPVTDSLIQDAVNYAGSPAWGDGKLLEGLKQILQILMPFITGCMGSQAALVKAVKDPSPRQGRRQNRQLRKQATREARKLKGVGWKDRRMLVEEALSGLDSVADSATIEQLESCYDEHN